MALKYTDYLITPADIYRGVLYLKNNIRRRDFVGIILLILVFSYTKNELGWQADSSIFFCFFLAIFFWDLDSRIPIALALIFLTACPLLLILSNNYNFLMGEDWAEQSAVWTYYLLVFGVAKQMWEFRRRGKKKSRRKKRSSSARKISKRKSSPGKTNSKLELLSPSPQLSPDGRGSNPKQMPDSRVVIPVKTGIQDKSEK